MSSRERRPLAGSSALGAVPGLGQADKKIVLSTWGGDYAKLLTKHVSTPVLAPKGWEVVNDEAQVVAAQGKDRRREAPAEGHVRRAGADRDRYRRNDRSRTCWRSSIFPSSRMQRTSSRRSASPTRRYFSPHIYSGKVVLYNPKLIKDVPTGMDSLWDPKNQGKVGIVDIQHVYTTMAAALVAGGKTGDFDKAKKALLELKKLKPRIYPSNEALAQALQTEEVGLCIMWKARAVQWQNAGANILTVAPKEGLIAYVSGFAIPKNAPNRDGRLCVPRCGAGAIGPGRLRRRHGLQPCGRQRQGARPT